MPQVGHDAALAAGACRGSASFCFNWVKISLRRPTAGAMPSVWRQTARRSASSKSSMVPTPAWSRCCNICVEVIGKITQSCAIDSRDTNRLGVNNKMPGAKNKFESRSGSNQAKTFSPGSNKDLISTAQAVGSVDSNAVSAIERDVI